MAKGELVLVMANGHLHLRNAPRSTPAVRRHRADVAQAMQGRRFRGGTPAENAAAVRAAFSDASRGRGGRHGHN